MLHGAATRTRAICTGDAPHGAKASGAIPELRPAVPRALAVSASASAPSLKYS